MNLDCKDFDDDPSALALHSLPFLSASQILFASYLGAAFSQDSVGILKSFSKALWVSL